MLAPVEQRAGSTCSGYWAIKLHEVLPASKHCSGHGVCWKRKCYCQAEFGGRSCSKRAAQPPSAAETLQTLRDLRQLSSIPHFRPPSPLLLMLSQPGNASRFAESVLMYDTPAVARIVLSVPRQHIEYAPTPQAVRFRACQIALANRTTCVAARFGKDFQHLNIAEVAQRWPDHDVFFAHADLYLRPELYGSMDRGALWLSTNPERDQYFWSRQSPLALLEVAEMEEGRLPAPEVLVQLKKGGPMPIRRGPSPAFNRAPSDTERLASAGRRGPCFALGELATMDGENWWADQPRQCAAAAARLGLKRCCHTWSDAVYLPRHALKAFVAAARHFPSTHVESALPTLLDTLHLHGGVRWQSRELPCQGCAKCVVPWKQALKGTALCSHRVDLGTAWEHFGPEAALVAWANEQQQAIERRHRPASHGRRLIEDVSHRAGAFEQHAWLRSPATVLHGHCGVTDVGPSDCATAERGSWPATTMDDCVARCLACENCNFVSLSTDPGNQDCSWFRSCPRIYRLPIANGTDDMYRSRRVSILTEPLVHSGARAARTCIVMAESRSLYTEPLRSYQLAFAINREYALRQGYDFRAYSFPCHRVPTSERRCGWSGGAWVCDRGAGHVGGVLKRCSACSHVTQGARAAPWCKLLALNATAHLRTENGRLLYHTLLYLDSDVHIFNLEAPLEQIWLGAAARAKHHRAPSLGLVTNLPFDEKGNSGIIVLTNDARGRRLLAEWWDEEAGAFSHSHPFEQLVFNDRLFGRYCGTFEQAARYHCDEIALLPTRTFVDSFRLQNFTNETSFEYARHVSSFLTAKLRLEWFASFAIARGVRLPASAEPSWASRLEMEVGSVATVFGSEGETLAAAAQGDGRGAFLE